MYQASCQSITGPGAKSRTDVEHRGDGVQHHPAQQKRHPDRHRRRLRQPGKSGIDGYRDDDDIGDGSDTGLIAQGDPHEKHHHTGHRRGEPDAHSGAHRQPLMEHIPRIQSETSAHHERHRESVQIQTHHQRGAARAPTNPFTAHGSILSANWLVIQ
ncbi:Uncharacterised protein [Mycobacteroides abscessus subsp. massiliense]|nr:Uncharacterised protein [Mycobacteroides abscessus subsp. massiliense]